MCKKQKEERSFGILATVKFTVVEMAYNLFTASNLPKEVTFSYFPVFTVTLPFQHFTLLSLFLLHGEG
jgi:hypothetical protein